MAELRQPTLEDVKQELESRFALEFHSAKFGHTATLTQYAPLFVRVEWGVDMKVGDNILKGIFNGYQLTIRKSETDKGWMEHTPMDEWLSMDQLIQILNRYCKQRTTEQIRLF